MKRSIYKKWENNDGEYPENFLRIMPNGVMVQVSIDTRDRFVNKASIAHTKPLTTINVDVLRKTKGNCTKAEFNKAVKRATGFLKGVK